MAAQWDIAPKAECTIKNIKCEIYIINELSWRPAELTKLEHQTFKKPS